MIRRARRQTDWAIGIAILLSLALLACDLPPASGATSATPGAPSVSPTPTDFDAGVILQEFPPGGPRNEVRVENTEDDRFKARASIRLHRVMDDDVNPVNIAFAQGRCTNCQTIAIAVQVVFYRRGAPIVRPENVALAANVGCRRCVTAARAIQYVIPVDDPKGDIPKDVDRLVKDMDKELRFLASIKTVDQLTSEEALARIQRVLDQYAQLSQYLRDVMQIERATDGGASPAPTVGTPAATAVPSASATPAPATATPSPTATP